MPAVRKIFFGWCEVKPGEWGLAVKASIFLADGRGADDFFREDGEAVPISDAEPEARILAWSKLPDLLHAIDRKLGELVGLVRGPKL